MRGIGDRVCFLPKSPSPQLPIAVLLREKGHDIKRTIGFREICGCR
jgi:hypothetical protein